MDQEVEQEEAARPRFERKIYTLDSKTWFWQVRDNGEENGLRRGHTQSGSSPTSEDAERMIENWVAGVLRVRSLAEIREATEWEPVDV